MNNSSWQPVAAMAIHPLPNNPSSSPRIVGQVRVGAPPNLHAVPHLILVRGSCTAL